jgi:DNA recombination protein RmuC
VPGLYPIVLLIFAVLAGVSAAGVLVLLWRSAGAAARFDGIARESERLERELRQAVDGGRREMLQAQREFREEQSRQLSDAIRTLSGQLSQLAQLQTARLDGFARQMSDLMQVNNDRLQGLTRLNDERLEGLRTTVEQRLRDLQTDNGRKLDEMRATVDEKLHKTLEERLAQSFKAVSERLEQVHQGLGEMHTLAAGVGDLKRVLTNVKTRGTWGEVQLGALLEQMLAPGQFERDVVTRRGSRDRVEYAVRMPGRDDRSEPCYLPIDAKFPQDDYQRLMDAHERADQRGIEEFGRSLEATIRSEARTIREKYIDPPATTDFAIMFLPTEGLYAEVLRRPGLSDEAQREHRVAILGPTTLAAFLNSLQMGFRTLAIERRSSEVWTVLGAVKAEFVKFADILDRTRKKLEEASNTIGQAEVRTRQIGRKLKSVEAMPEVISGALLGVDESQEELPLPPPLEEEPAERVD